MATVNQISEIVPDQLPNHKVKYKQPMQRACNERNAKGKICGGHLKRWSYGSDVKEQACGDIVTAWGRGAEVYRCEHCKTLYLPNPDDLSGRNVAGYGSISDFGLTLPPKDAAAKPTAAGPVPSPEAAGKASGTPVAPTAPVHAPAATPAASSDAVAVPPTQAPVKAAPAQNPVSAAAQDVKDAPLKDPKSADATPVAISHPATDRPQVVEQGAITVDAVKTSDTVKRVDAPTTESGVKAVASVASPANPSATLPAAPPSEQSLPKVDSDLRDAEEQPKPPSA